MAARRVRKRQRQHTRQQRHQWTGIYVSGVGTYVEIFAEGADFRLGQAGVGLFTQKPGGVDDIDYHFRKSFGKRATRELMTLGTPDRQEPFAHIASYTGQDSTNVSLWVMEYHEEFYRTSGVPVGSSHATLQAAWRSGKKYTKLMGDIQNITLRPTNKPTDLITALEAIGYVTTDSTRRSAANRLPAGSTAGDATWRRGTNGITILPPLPHAPQHALTAARFTLTRKPAKSKTVKFGPHSTLTISPNGTAEWRFR